MVEALVEAGQSSIAALACCLPCSVRVQVPDAEKRRLADYVINTSTDLATTRRQVADLVAELRGREGPGAGGADEAWPGAAG